MTATCSTRLPGAIAWLALLVAGAQAASGPDVLRSKVGSQLLAPPASAARARSTLVAREPWRDGTRVHVYVRVRESDEAAMDALRRSGLEIVVVNAGFGLVDGWVEQAALPALAALPFVGSIRPVAAPERQAGAVVTAGDAGLGADQVRNIGFDGSGVVLGLISDGIDSLATSQGTGELPAAVAVPTDPRCGSFPGDEGTAMLEIVHDIAPGASLLFGSFGQSGAQMAETVRCLADAGSQVIVDDVTFPDEPFYQDGPLAIAAREVVQRGVTYHTSAGNRREEFVEQQFAGAFGGPGIVVHDFGGGDIRNEILIGAGSGASCVLQWDEPFGGAATDFDLFAAVGPTVIGMSDNPQDGTEPQDPVELLSIDNQGDTDQVVSLVIQLFSGNPQRLLRLMCFRSGGMQHISLEGAIYGQQSVPEVIAVGSIDVADPGHDTIEDSSSPGPAKIFFPTPEVREKPDIASFDGVATSVPGFEIFFGTSAAAPHTGAVAALMLSKNIGLSPAQIQDVMRRTAVDIDAPGFDHFAGAGRLDALAAMGGVGCLEVARIPAQAPCKAGSIADLLKGVRKRLQQADGAPAARAAKLARAAAKRITKAFKAIDKRAGKLDAGCAAFLRATFVLASNAANCRLRAAGG